MNKNGFNVVHVPTALLVGGLGILAWTNVQPVHCLQASPESRILNIQSRSLTAREFTDKYTFSTVNAGFLPLIHAYNGPEPYFLCNNHIYST